MNLHIYILVINVINSLFIGLRLSLTHLLAFSRKLFNALILKCNHEWCRSCEPCIMDYCRYKQAKHTYATASLLAGDTWLMPLTFTAQQRGLIDTQCTDLQIE